MSQPTSRTGEPIGRLPHDVFHSRAGLGAREYTRRADELVRCIFRRLTR